jgi:hypothetical protein
MEPAKVRYALYHWRIDIARLVPQLPKKGAERLLASDKATGNRKPSGAPAPADCASGMTGPLGQAARWSTAILRIPHCAGQQYKPHAREPLNC